MTEPRPHPFHVWLGRELEKTGTSWAAFGRESGIGESFFNRWKNDAIAPSVSKVRQVVKGLGLPEEDILRLLVIAQILKPSEVRQQIVVPDPDLLSDEEIIQQVTKRLRRRRAGEASYDHRHPDDNADPIPLFHSSDP